MSNDLADLLKTYNDKIVAMEARIAFLEKLEASTSGSPPPDAVLYTPQVESGARQLQARTNIGAMPLVSPATFPNLVEVQNDGTLADGGYRSSVSAIFGSVVKRDGAGVLFQQLSNPSYSAYLENTGAGVGAVLLSASGTGATSTSTSGTYHHSFGAVSAIARTTGALTFVGGSAATNRAAQRVALGFEEAATKATPIDADSLLMIDSAASNVVKRVTWANVKSVIQTAFNSVYVTLGTSQTIVAAGTKIWQGLQTFQAGANFSYSRLTSLVATAHNNVLWGRRGDIDHLRILDYQDEAALWGERAAPYDSITFSTAPSAFGGGDVDLNIFRDDSTAVQWTSGTPFPIAITIDSSTNPVTVKGNATWQVGLTFRSEGVTITNIQVEIWDGSGYISVHNAAPGNNGTETSGFGYWISPRFLSDVGTGFDIQRLRVTINGDNAAIANNFRIQRLQLYHDTAAWDTFAQERFALVRQRATILPFHAESDGTITLTNQPSTEQFLSNSSRNITKFDLTQYTQCRLITRVTTGSASANSPRLRVRYRTTFSTTESDYSDIGTSEVSTSLTSTGVIDSGWVNLAAGALADVFVTVTQLGGDGAADPAYGMLMVHFR